MSDRKRTGCAYLLISHDLAVVRQVADEVMVMRCGEVCESGYRAGVPAAEPSVYGRIDCRSFAA